MADRGVEVTNVCSDGVAARAAQEAADAAGVERDPAADGEPQSISKLDGITDDQATRIREAVRARKRNRPATSD